MAFAEASKNPEVVHAFDWQAATRAHNAIFLVTKRIVTEKTTESKDFPNPVECDVYVIDGQFAKTVEYGCWIWATGMLRHMDLTPGGRSFGQLEFYNARGRECYGLTEGTSEQKAIAQRIDNWLDQQAGQPAQPAPAPQQPAPPAQANGNGNGSNYPIGTPAQPPEPVAAGAGAYGDTPPW